MGEIGWQRKVTSLIGMPHTNLRDPHPPGTQLGGRRLGGGGGGGLFVVGRGALTFLHSSHAGSDVIFVSSVQYSGDHSFRGFFLVCEDFGRMFDNSFLACAFFF